MNLTISKWRSSKQICLYLSYVLVTKRTSSSSMDLFSTLTFPPKQTQKMPGEDLLWRVFPTHHVPSGSKLRMCAFQSPQGWKFQQKPDPARKNKCFWKFLTYSIEFLNYIFFWGGLWTYPFLIVFF